MLDFFKEFWEKHGDAIMKAFDSFLKAFEFFIYTTLKEFCDYVVAKIKLKNLQTI